MITESATGTILKIPTSFPAASIKEITLFDYHGNEAKVVDYSVRQTKTSTYVEIPNFNLHRVTIFIVVNGEETKLQIEDVHLNGKFFGITVTNHSCLSFAI